MYLRTHSKKKKEKKKERKQERKKKRKKDDKPGHAWNWEAFLNCLRQNLVL